MQRREILSLLFLFSGLFLSSCATTRSVTSKYTPQELYAFACQSGKTIESVQGQVWMKLKSSEISGQFPANVLVNAPDQLELEVTNFLGGTEAAIFITRDSYEIKNLRGKSEKQKVGTQTWGGIPLKWATGLFLGRIPCPTLSASAHLSIESDGDLNIRIGDSGKPGAQTFVYSFRDVEGKPWPDSLHWEALSSMGIVDFEFEDPEKETFSPKKWTARSPRGEVKVRWRERSIFKSPIH